MRMPEFGELRKTVHTLIRDATRSMAAEQEARR
jgi:hypothetical protein